MTDSAVHPNSNQQRANALVGALVADAASMGLHWLYDQEHISRIAQTGDILFRQPDAEHYAGVKSYFAHGVKRRGEFSQYGESALATTKAITGKDSYDTKKHQQVFFDTFGPCGSYHGFADRPTKAFVAKMITEADNLPLVSGSDDDQLPALCSIPALFANECGVESVSNAVSVTSTHDDALSGAHALYDCLSRIYAGESIADALSHSAASANTTLANHLNDAINLPTYQPLEAAQQFGLACHIKQGLPVAWHLLLHADSFEGAVRDNIRCGGDCCGRAMAIGAVAGLLFGVPEKFIENVNRLH